MHNLKDFYTGKIALKCSSETENIDFYNFCIKENITWSNGARINPRYDFLYNESIENFVYTYRKTKRFKTNYIMNEGIALTDRDLLNKDIEIINYNDFGGNTDERKDL